MSIVLLVNLCTFAWEITYTKEIYLHKSFTAAEDVRYFNKTHSYSTSK